MNARIINFYAAATGKPGVPEPAPKRERAAPTAPPDGGEAPVLAAIAQLLAVHPLVVMALRCNSGAAQREVAPGRWAPIWFWRLVRYPGAPMTLPAFVGFCQLGVDLPVNAVVPLALEAKRPDWKGVKTDSEQRQARYLEFIRSIGGRAGFARSADEADRILRGD